VKKQALAGVCMMSEKIAEVWIMRRTLVVITLVGFAASAFGQSVYLKVTPMESRMERKDNDQHKIIGSSGSFSKKVEREEVFNVTVKNMAPAAYEYTVEWMFMASPAGGGSKVEPIHAEEKKVPLDKNASTTFEVRSPKLESTHTHYSFVGGQDAFTGLKFAGYVVRARLDDKILAVEATDVVTKRKFQDPKAKWGVPEEPATTKKKTSR